MKDFVYKKLVFCNIKIELIFSWFIILIFYEIRKTTDASVRKCLDIGVMRTKIFVMNHVYFNFYFTIFFIGWGWDLFRNRSFQADRQEHLRRTCHPVRGEQEVLREQGQGRHPRGERQACYGGWHPLAPAGLFGHVQALQRLAGMHDFIDYHSSPLGGADKGKKASAPSLPLFVLSLSHLTAIHGTKAKEIYYNVIFNFCI